MHHILLRNLVKFSLLDSCHKCKLVASIVLGIEVDTVFKNSTNDQGNQSSRLL